MLLWFEIRTGRHNFSSLLAENLVPNSVEDVDYCGEILPFGSDLIGFVIEIFLHKKVGKQRNLCISIARLGGQKLKNCVSYNMEGRKYQFLIKFRSLFAFILFNFIAWFSCLGCSNF